MCGPEICPLISTCIENEGEQLVIVVIHMYIEQRRQNRHYGDGSDIKDGLTFF